MIDDNNVRINIDHYQKIICIEKRPHCNSNKFKSRQIEILSLQYRFNKLHDIKKIFYEVQKIIYDV